VRIAPAMLAVFASVFVVGITAPVQTVAAATGAQCTNWTSRQAPPPDIAVYRVSEGFVERVNFKDYVARVVSREWNVKYHELRKAGAVAVKQYAWYHVLKWRGGTYNGKCFDVRDSTADQLYASKPTSQIPGEIKRAVNDTWTWRLRRADGKFPMTGYRRGADVPCADDAGYRLYVRSGKKCAAAGWSTEQILQTYYTANLEK
jgi:peptidoglycan hydrolase-like amidase